MIEEVHNDLRSRYDIVYLNTLSNFFTKPITFLAEELSLIRTDSYQDNQRIVIVDDVAGHESNKQDFVRYLYKLLAHLDITNFFVLIAGHDPDILDSTKPNTADTTNIQYTPITTRTRILNQVTNYRIPESVCVNPWINLAVFEDGRISPCCLIEDGSEPTLNENTLSTVSDGHRELRSSFLRGERPTACSKCWTNETAGKLSKRQNDQYVFRDHYFLIDWNQISKTDLISLDIKLKNTCNLSCRICGPRFSSRWYDEMSKHPEIYPEINRYKNIKIEWTESTDQKLWSELEQIGNNIRYITFSGGEPLLDKAHVKLLQYMIEQGISDKVRVHYNTNATVYAKNLVEIWEQFRSVELSFSIDNVGNKFEYERHGAEWAQVVSVVDQYLTLDRRKFSFNINNTVSVLNILDLYDLYRFALNKNLNLSFNMLTDPLQLNIVNLNSQQKQFVAEKLQSIDDFDFKKLAEPVIAYLHSTNSSNCSSQDIVDYLSRTDQVRGQSFESTHTELTRLLQTTGENNVSRII